MDSKLPRIGIVKHQILYPRCEDFEMCMNILLRVDHDDTQDFAEGDFLKQDKQKLCHWNPANYTRIARSFKI